MKCSAIMPARRRQLRLQVAKDGILELQRFTVHLRYVRRADGLTAAVHQPFALKRLRVAWAIRCFCAFPKGMEAHVREGSNPSDARVVDTLAMGERAWRFCARPGEALPFGVAEVPLPGGLEVVSDQTQGRYDRLEVRDDRVAFFFTAMSEGATEALMQNDIDMA